jgi:hypothetical protein
LPCSVTLSCSPCPEAHYRKYDHDEHDFIVSDVGSVLGKCMFNKDLLAEEDQMALIGKDGFNWAGTFSGTCYLENSGKDHCELPEGCEDTVLQIQVKYLEGRYQYTPLYCNAIGSPELASRPLGTAHHVHAQKLRQWHSWLH